MSVCHDKLTMINVAEKRIFFKFPSMKNNEDSFAAISYVFGVGNIYRRRHVSAAQRDNLQRHPTPVLGMEQRSSDMLAKYSVTELHLSSKGPFLNLVSVPDFLFLSVFSGQ